MSSIRDSAILSFFSGSGQALLCLEEAEMKDNLWRARYILERKKDGKMIPHYIIDDIKYHRNNVSSLYYLFL